MKKNLTVIISCILILGMFTSVVYAATASDYSFNMVYRYVSGKDNNQMHHLNNGKAYISGQQVIYDPPYSKAPKMDISYSLYRNKVFFDELIGTLKFKEDTTPVSISGCFGSVTEGNYYLMVHKPDVNGNKVKGSGFITN